MKHSHLSSIRAVLLDMDGVIYRDEQLLPGVSNFLSYLQASKRRWLFVTNNATRTPAMFVEKLARLGVKAEPSQVLSSAEATANWLAEQAPAGARVQIVGQEGLTHALFSRGFVAAADPFEADYVVVGMDFQLTYASLAAAALALNHGARFIGTNSDVSFPSERGEVPGAGSILALLQTATGVQPEIIGKPYPGMFVQAMHLLGLEAEQLLMVGDRYETDIVGAVKLGLATAAVLTGITSRAEFDRAQPPPQIVVPGLPELQALFVEADAAQP